MLARQDMVVRQTRSILELEKTQNSGEKEENTVERHKTQLTVEKGTRHSGEKSRGLMKATNVGKAR